MSETHEVVIIGGGVGGLYTAHKLIKAGVKNVKVYEGRPFVGGRIRTTRDDDKKPILNDFAWRVGETNKRMLALAKEIGVELKEQFSPPAPAPASQTTRRRSSAGKSKSTGPKPAPLSAFATASLESAALADDRDRATGYASLSREITFPGESHGSRHWVPVDGMHDFVVKIAALLPEGVVNTGHRCIDVTRTDDGYRVDLLTKRGTTPLTVNAKKVVLAAPPVSLRHFTVARHGLGPALDAVTQARNAHVYVRCKPAANVPDTSGDAKRIYRVIPDSVLQQFISGDYGHSVFQAGYATGRFERVWRELQYQGKAELKEHVVRQLDKLIASVLPELKGIEVEEVLMRFGFVSRWVVEAFVNGKNKAELSSQAQYPNAALLPNLHLVGEAFSAHQGWTEGALQTAEECAALIVGGMDKASVFSKPIKMAGKEHMKYQGLVLDVSTWAARHPGGAGPIMGFGGKDVTNTFESFHPGWPHARATVFGLQAGVSLD